MISVSNVSKAFGRISLLEDVSFSLAAGEKASLLGPGGCGKSTVLKIILGLLAPDVGDVTLLGTHMATATEEERRVTLKQVGMAFQQGALFDFMTVTENLSFAIEHMTDLAPDKMNERIKYLLDGVKLGKTGGQFPYELSGGMQRRVGIARALATEPKVAIFDEPTAGLDPVTSTIILNMILDLGKAAPDTTALIATSNVEIAMRFSERVILIYNGTVVADGPWPELLMRGPEWVRTFLSIRLIGLDYDYAKGLNLPKEFLEKNWDKSGNPIMSPRNSHVAKPPKLAPPSVGP